MCLWKEHSGKIRGALEKILADVDVDHLTVEALVAHIAAIRERPLTIWPASLPSPLFGVVMVAPSTDYIMYEQDTPQFHQYHIIFHELGHLVLGHPVIIVTEDLKPGPELRQALGNAGLRASRFDLKEEQEAEAFATAVQRFVLEQAGLHALTDRLSTAPGWTSLAHGLSLD